MIPVWGSGKQAIHDFECGNWGWGLINTGLAISDVFLVKTLVSAAGKGVWKIGVHTWDATRKWLTRSGWREYAGQHFHHWLIPQNGWGKIIPGVIKNQPWNLMGLSEAAHRALHRKGINAYSLSEKFWYGTPWWFKVGGADLGGKGINNLRGNDCECN